MKLNYRRLNMVKKLNLNKLSLKALRKELVKRENEFKPKCKGDIFFFRSCPNCGFISGFSLDDEEIKKNEKYYCSECAEENTLSEWNRETIFSYDFEKEVWDFFKERKYDKVVLLSKLKFI